MPYSVNTFDGEAIPSAALNGALMNSGTMFKKNCPMLLSKGHVPLCGVIFGIVLVSGFSLCCVEFWGGSCLLEWVGVVGFYGAH
jgi:hypothetical protein